MFDMNACRYRCTDCHDFNLCDECFNEPRGTDKNGVSIKLHVLQHSFTKSGTQSAKAKRSLIVNSSAVLSDRGMLHTGARIQLHSLPRDLDLQGKFGIIKWCRLDDDGELIYRVQLDGDSREYHVPESYTREVRQPQLPRQPMQDAKRSVASPQGKSGATKAITSNKQLDDHIEKDNVVIVGMFASWCRPCVQFMPTFDDAAKGAPELTMVTVDVDKHVQILTRFRVQAFPTVLFILKGKLLHEMTIVGYDPRKLEKTISQLRCVVNKLEKDEKKKTMVGDSMVLTLITGSQAELLGRNVEINGLCMRPDLNGKIGIAQDFVSSSSRYHVKVYGSEEVIALKCRNLREVKSAPPSPKKESQSIVPPSPSSTTPQPPATTMPPSPATTTPTPLPPATTPDDVEAPTSPASPSAALSLTSLPAPPDALPSPEAVEKTGAPVNPSIHTFFIPIHTKASALLPLHTALSILQA
ncbi:MAG: hypothetical protein SGPRY_010706 [Prymnesium sp.]